jgi:cytochrome c peroxidase
MRGLALIFVGILFYWSLLCAVANENGGTTQAAPTHRSPIDLALVGDGPLAFVANHTADSVALVDLEGRTVLAEKACGRKPVAVAVSPDGKRAAVSNLWSGSLTLLAIENRTLAVVKEVKVGAFPRGLVFAPDGASLFAALAGQDEVVRLDWATLKVSQRWPAPREPRSLTLSADGKWLAAASSRSGQVRCWNLATGKLHWERTIDDAFNLRGLAFTPQTDAVICVHAVRRDQPVTKEHIERGWVINNRLTRLDLKADVVPAAAQIALDPFGQAVGDPHGLAFASDGRWLALTAGGTQELVLLAADAIPWTHADPGDHLPVNLQNRATFRRIALGGRPLAMAIRKAGAQAVVANYLLDAVQIVDLKTGQVEGTIPLGDPKQPSVARQGEALFHDARRSHHQWFSCQTCHVEGQTCGMNFDTLNDDTYGTPKLTPSLYNVTRTGPWTWHGRQEDLGASVVKSFTTTMFGPRPTPAETAAVLAYLDTLKPPPNPHREADGTLSLSAQRGEQLFKGKATCARCHREPFYTTPAVYDVKLIAEGSPYKTFNPPSLLNVFERGPYLHDGRARSLDDVLQKHHRPELVGGEKLTDAERADLIAFLRSL